MLVIFKYSFVVVVIVGAGHDLQQALHLNHKDLFIDVNIVMPNTPQKTIPGYTLLKREVIMPFFGSAVMIRVFNIRFDCL